MIGYTFKLSRFSYPIFLIILAKDARINYIIYIVGFYDVILLGYSFAANARTNRISLFEDRPCNNCSKGEWFGLAFHIIGNELCYLFR
jgi:hypothetical protein